VNKSKLRSKISRLRKFKFRENLKINLEKIFQFLKYNKINVMSVGGYYPYNYEIDDLEILKKFRKKKIIVSLPIIKKNNQMDFFEWSKNNPLKINKYGIIEPTSKKKIYPDLILIPLLAYDIKLNRLGYGGGFYDRYIEKIEKKKKILKIGLAFSFQKVNRVPINEYDKKLDLIITEKNFIK
tara:strand:- start:1007 stop:1552 length:546 start_codon:yes stop_codon:yes gene_type:complete